MAIVTQDGLTAALLAGQPLTMFKSTLTSKGSGSYASLWTATGYPGAGATPASGAGAVPTNATAGAMPYSSPAGSNTMYLAQLGGSTVTAIAVILIDRLVHTSGLSGTSTSAQTVNSSALTRYTSGVGVQAWLECYTQLGATAVTASVSYTNTAGTSGQTGTAAIPATMLVGQVVPINLAAGDSGIESVQTVTLSATTGTAGNFGITLVYPLAQLLLTTALTQLPMDYAALGAPIMQGGVACVSAYVLTTSTATGNLYLTTTFIQG